MCLGDKSVIILLWFIKALFDDENNEDTSENEEDIADADDDDKEVFAEEVFGECRGERYRAVYTIIICFLFSLLGSTGCPRVSE